MNDRRNIFLILLAFVVSITTQVASDVAGGGATPDRYSRQVYTLGARAHGEIRRSIIYVDGPMMRVQKQDEEIKGDDENGETCSVVSGLMMECLKNLALSGVGEIILLHEDSEHESSRKFNILHESYCEKIHLDDLGSSYLRSAREECGEEYQDEIMTSVEDVVAEYIRRLNPQVKVSQMRRHDFLDRKQQRSTDQESQKCLICIDRPESTQLLLSARCRTKLEDEIKFIAVETQGLYGRLFCDFGSKHKVFDEDGENPKQTLVRSVEVSPDENDDNIYLVNCEEGEKHDVSRDDIVEFITRDGTYLEGDLWSVDKVFTPFLFSCRKLGDHSSDLGILSSSTVTRKKQPRSIPFLGLNDALKIAKGNTDILVPDGHQLYTPSDLSKSFDECRRDIIMAAFSSFSTYVETYLRTPSASSKEDMEDFKKLILSSGFLDDELTATQTNVEKSILKSFSSGGKFVPMQAFFGALAAQEALKSVSGLYNPISQFLLFDCAELDSVMIDECREEWEGFFDSTPGQSSLLGKSFSALFASQRLFVVGSGAIGKLLYDISALFMYALIILIGTGCEILKNLAAMGAGSLARGSVILTDMDTIEHSNLSRQLLFRDSDVGKFKSIAAKEAVARFNSALRLEAHTSKVGDKEDGPFNDHFWTYGVDFILNALDNVDARLFIDGKCVESQKGMVDAGTLGAKGNVQVVVPMKSESYGSSADPPEPAIPVCTLKNFPYDISHTIQWGRDLFDGLFNRRPTQANGILSSMVSSNRDILANDLVKKLGKDAAEEIAFEISDDLDISWKAALESEGLEEALRELSIQWAIELAHKLFVSATEDLLYKHPEDSVDEDGEPFWSGTRRMPKIVCYNNDVSDSFQHEINLQLIEFVRAAARLRLEMYLGSHNQHSIGANPPLDQVRLALESYDNVEVQKNGIPESPINSILDRVTMDFPVFLNAVEFEKDDEQNDHVAFVNAASNLRALAYGIKPVDAMETRRVAGRIVPAMITTTALVSALSCLEIVKLIGKVPLQEHRNAFINLALPFFALTSPLPAEKIEGINGRSYTLWDRITIKEKRKSAKVGGMTLQQILKKVKRLSGAKVSSLSYGPYLLYADFLHEEDDDLMLTPIWEVVKDALLSDEDVLDKEEDWNSKQCNGIQQQEVDIFEKKLFVEFSAVVEGDDEEEYELPPIRLLRYQHGND